MNIQENMESLRKQNPKKDYRLQWCDGCCGTRISTRDSKNDRWYCTRCSKFNS